MRAAIGQERAADRLAGRTALVTGAGSGIGAGIARAYAAEGAALAVADLDGEAAAATARECRALGAAVSVHEVDVADETSTRTMVDTATTRHGRVDILVNSAGIQTQTPFLEMSAATFDRIVAVDLRGVFLCSRWAAPQMVERGWGRIVNVSSQLALKGGVELSHYSAAKAGVLGLTKAMARELAGRGVLVNALAPGPVDTPINDRMDATWLAAKRAELPLGRFGEVREVTPAAVLLASDPGGNLFVGQTLGPNSGDIMP